MFVLLFVVCIFVCCIVFLFCVLILLFLHLSEGEREAGGRKGGTFVLRVFWESGEGRGGEKGRVFLNFFTFSFHFFVISFQVFEFSFGRENAKK